MEHQETGMEAFHYHAFHYEQIGGLRILSCSGAVFYSFHPRPHLNTGIIAFSEESKQAGL